MVLNAAPSPPVCGLAPKSDSAPPDARSCPEPLRQTPQTRKQHPPSAATPMGAQTQSAHECVKTLRPRRRYAHGSARRSAISKPPSRVPSQPAEKGDALLSKAASFVGRHCRAGASKGPFAEGQKSWRVAAWKWIFLDPVRAETIACPLQTVSPACARSMPARAPSGDALFRSSPPSCHKTSALHRARRHEATCRGRSIARGAQISRRLSPWRGSPARRRMRRWKRAFQKATPAHQSSHTQSYGCGDDMWMS